VTRLFPYLWLAGTIVGLGEAAGEIWANGYLGLGMSRSVLLVWRGRENEAVVRILAYGAAGFVLWRLHRGRRRAAVSETAAFALFLAAAAGLNALLDATTGYSLTHAARRLAVQSRRLFAGELDLASLGALFREHAGQLVVLAAGLAGLVAAYFFLRARPQGWHRLDRWLALERLRRLEVPLLRASWIAAAGLLGLNLAAEIDSHRATASDRPNVVIVVADALRRDHVGFYGYWRDTTPGLDRLAKESVVFDRAHSQSSYTKASIASLFTSRYPSQHGAVNNDQALAPGLLTMAEILREEGYETAAFTENPVIAARFGFDQGFARWETDYRRHEALDDRPMDEFDTRLFRWLEGSHRRPFALYVHYIDPHDPYVPPPGFRDLFADTLPADERAEKILRYDQEIRYVDARASALVEKLRSRGLLDRTVFVFLSDHGEGFGPPDRGEGHATSVYGEVIDIPLLVRFPKLPAGTRSDRLASQVDVLPTLLSLLGIDRPEGLEGRDLFSPLADSADPEGTVLSEHLMTAGHRRQRAWLRGPWKLVQHLDAGRLELFDLEHDPGEAEDLAGRRPDVVAALARELEDRLAALGPAVLAPVVSVDAELRRKLRALGYVQ
jgi:arylsulfatase A-like enzyme